MPKEDREPDRTRSRRSPNDAGFTLLEVLVALAILGTAVVASIQGFAQGLRLLKLSGDHQQAMLLADQKTREIVTPAEGREEGTEGVFRWKRTTALVPAPDLQPPTGLPVWRVWQISVLVQWDTSRQVEVATLRTTPVVPEPTVTPATAPRPNPRPGGGA